MLFKVILVDDHKIIREGLRALLEKEGNIEIIGEAEDGTIALQMLKKSVPDIIVMDISMPKLNGIEATRQIKHDYPDIRIIALSMHRDNLYISNMLEAGASAFLLKDCAAEELIKAIHTVMSNQTYLSPEITDFVVKDYVNFLKRKGDSILNKLSSRELEVLQKLVEGNSTKEIAFQLHLSVKTVETHRQQIMSKLDVHSIAELTKIAIREGLTTLE